LKKLWYVLSIQEKFDMAIQMYKKAYKLQKWDIEVLNMLTQLNFYTWDYLSCIKYAKKFLKLKPKDSENLQLLASAYEKSQSIKEALEVYKELSNLKPYDTKIQSKIEALSVE
jgi:tetratricopeptide (TPR) repeat protein